GPWASSAAGPHAAVSCARSCAHGEWLRSSPGPSSRRVSHNGGEVSSREKRLRAASSFSAPSAPGRHCCHGRKPARALLFNATDGLGGERVRRRSPAKPPIFLLRISCGSPFFRGWHEPDWNSSRSNSRALAKQSSAIRLECLDATGSPPM